MSPAWPRPSDIWRRRKPAPGQQVASGGRPLPSSSSGSSGTVLLISMVLLASLAASAAGRSSGAPSQSDSGNGKAEAEAAAAAARLELDFESATISHASPAASAATTTSPKLDPLSASNERLRELNESLRALNKMVGESRLGPVGGNAADGPASDPNADSEELDYLSESELEEPAPAGGSARFKQSLVRQLSDLMMNQEEPEVVVEALGSERGQRRGRQLTPAGATPAGPQWRPAAGLASEESTSSSDGASAGVENSSAEHNLLQQVQADDEAAMITCPPDYDERSTLLVPTNISELFGETFVANISQLTSEQRQQLLSGGPGGEGLALALVNEATELNETALLQQQLEWQQQQQHRHMQMRPPCRSVGMARIDVITKTITPILFGIIIVIGLVGNVVVMLVILEERKVERELTPTNLLILDLSLADLSFIIFCIPFTGWDYATGYWAFGSLWCKLNQYLIVVCALSSIYTLVLMSCDRFMAIVYPIECISYRTSRNMMHAIVIKWIVILLAASPAIEMHGLISSPIVSEQHICRFLSDRHNPLHFQIVFFLTSYLFPLVLIFGLYLSLLNKLWFGQKPHGHKESHKMLESKKKVTWLVASIVIVFAVCWCPIQIMLILMRLKTLEITATYIAIQVFAHTLGYMNSCVNPIVYAFASETFYQSFRRSRLARLFCCTPNSALYYNNSNNGLSQANNNNNNSTIISSANYSSRPQHNFKQFTHHPTDSITLTTHLHGLVSGPGSQKLAPRSSLQIDTAAGSQPRDGGVHHGNTTRNGNNNNNNNNNNSHRNTSLDHIFGQRRPEEELASSDRAPMSALSNFGQVTPATRRLPLEPRDRDQPISPTPTNRPTSAAGEQPAVTQVNASGSSNNSPPTNSMPGAESSSNPPATSKPSTGNAAAKQQLVARVVQQSSGAASQVVAHQCELCEQNEY